LRKRGHPTGNPAPTNGKDFGLIPKDKKQINPMHALFLAGILLLSGGLWDDRQVLVPHDPLDYHAVHLNTSRTPILHG
jgi:hypothetical protein